MKYKTVFDHPRKKHAMEVFGKEPSTMEEFFQMTIDCINDFFIQRDEDIRATGLAMQVQHNSHISNSHSRPLMGSCNFMLDEMIPLGYSGWGGRVWVRYSNRPNTWGSDPFKNGLSNTGTGGAGSYIGPWEKIASTYYHADKRLKNYFTEPAIYSWDYKLFDMDFPEIINGTKELRQYTRNITEYNRLLEVYKAELTWYKATGKNYPASPAHPDEPSFYQAWTDPVQEEKDNAFIDLIKKTNSRRVLNKTFA